ncbi:hypothetical protein DSO57_1000078 [Entomophthora muscae]|uniref:Uncharacterized protein n=1 Tax=Entomophthora muscae TaxID=34485 RepID=A0ACC2SMD9_9FUNG|nr:hypothetical protein DSO57_1000078 [Entomophthora muscae]
MRSEIKNSRSTKFKTKWSGPYRIYQVGKNYNYYLEDCEGVQFAQPVNGSRLKLYHA